MRTDDGTGSDGDVAAVGDVGIDGRAGAGRGRNGIVAGSVPVDASDLADLFGDAGLGDAGLGDPDLDDPAKAAMQYRRLLGASDEARARAGRDARDRRQDGRAAARRHRDAAQDIRARVRSVWDQVAEPLAQYGLTELDQLRSAAGDASAEAAAAVPRVGLAKKGTADRGLYRDGGGYVPAEPGDRRGRSLAQAGREADRTGRGLARQRHRSDGLPLGAGRAARDGRAGGPHEPSAAQVDPRTAPRQAYELCLDAMSKAAELRAVSKGTGPASAGLLTALACLLILGIVGLLRAFVAAPALPCLVGSTVAAAVLVALGAGGEDGAKAVLRAGTLGAGTAAVMVLATFRLAPMEPVGVIASLAALAVAVRFGLGLGGGQASAGASKSGGSRSGGSRKG